MKKIFVLSFSLLYLLLISGCKKDITETGTKPEAAIIYDSNGPEGYTGCSFLAPNTGTVILPGNGHRFYVELSYIRVNQSIKYYFYVYGQDAHVFLIGTTSGDVKLLQKSDSINPNQYFIPLQPQTTSFDGMALDGFPTVEGNTYSFGRTGYIGYLIKEGENNIYGWVEVSINVNPTSSTCIYVYNLKYQAHPNFPNIDILAGQL